MEKLVRPTIVMPFGIELTILEMEKIVGLPNKNLSGEIMNGEWIIVHPTDCFTLLPVYECSECKETCSGYEPDPVCFYCGSKNKINDKKSVSRPLFDDAKEEELLFGVSK